jgi:hypothetical protein
MEENTVLTLLARNLTEPFSELLLEEFDPVLLYTSIEA